ncbi:hypothetical protein WMY93_001959 [Mugilogobius chulae]|uniref:Uncharacterized protein n=1 Tax=Mugilogobius chulae TaxID=88201 RepID=A0AAW0PSD8_9GOBI
MLFPRWIWFVSGLLLLVSVSRRRWCVGAMPLGQVPKLVYSHAGLCPNELNPNLWVDAMSTCMRECESDQDCESFEKCCPNVCGNKSCVAARYIDVKGNKGPIGMPKGATCDKFMCSQQGSVCDIWDGQPVCKCRDRCEGNRISHIPPDLAQHQPSPRRDHPPPHHGPADHPPGGHPATGHPQPSHPADRLRGDTASFLCEVSGKPHPEITWEKQLKGRDNTVLRPNHVRGNTVVTNIGQLVIYNAQLQDAGIYTCTAKNVGGSASAHFPLAVVKKELRVNSTNLPFPAEECLKSPDTDHCGEDTMSWYYESKRNNCFPFTYSQCNKNRNHFDTYESCMLSCGGELAAPCSLPSLQGPASPTNHDGPTAASSRNASRSFMEGVAGTRTTSSPRKFVKNRARFRKITTLTEEQESGHALVTVDEILKDDKMGLRFFGKEPLEVTLLNVNWNCPCPNITVADSAIIIMGDVHNGMAVLQPDSFVSASSSRRVRKLREVVHKNTCHFLKEFPAAQ